MEPIFSDKDVRDFMNLNKQRATYKETGLDTIEYRLCKALRDAIEDEIRDAQGVVEHMRLRLVEED